jgi:glycosyltransferase involved in cell wall biosynthesis
MYSGNMGLGHRFSEFLEASLLTGERVRWAFFGGGKRKIEIGTFIDQHPEARLELHDYVAHRDLYEHLCSADLHLASLELAWDGTMVPSKLQGIAASGRPILFVGSQSSSIGRWIAEFEAGWVVPPGDTGALLKAVEEALDPGESRRRGEAAAEMARTCFHAPTNVARVAAFLTASAKRR